MSATSIAICNAVFAGCERRSPTSAEQSSYVVLVDAQGYTQDQCSQAESVASEAQSYVYPIMRAYQGYFDRVPDSSGLDYWVGVYRGTSGAPSKAALVTATSGWATSSEFITKYGSLSNSDFVTQLYNNLYGRSPDSSGLTYWTGQLDSGVSRAAVMVEFTEATEFQNLANGAIATFLRAAGNGDTSIYNGLPLI